MTILYSAHAVIEIGKRQLRVEWIEETVRRPDWTVPDPDDPAVLRSYRKINDFGGRTLRVAHRPENADILVITAFFDRSARKP